MKCDIGREWAWTKIGRICKTNVSSYSPSERWPFVNYLETKGISEGRISEIQHLLLPKQSLPCRARRKVSKNDIVYSTVRPNQRHYGIIKEPLPNMLVSTGFSVLTVDPAQCDAAFLYYWLSQNHIVETLQALAEQSVSTFPTIRDADLEALEILLPPLPEQKRIAAILSALDDKIELNNKINANLECQAQALFKAWFEDVSPERLPFGWRFVTFGDVVTISKRIFSPSAVSEMQLEHYSIPAFDEGRFPVFESSTSVKSNKFIVDKDCFMISKLNPTTKRVWRPYCLSETAVCSTEFIVYKAKDVNMTDFLYSVVDSATFSDFMCSHVTGSTGSRQRTNPSETLAFELVVPSDDKLLEFQSIVAPMYARIRANAIENDRLRRIRDAVLPKLMSGEIDVSDVSFPKL